MTFQHKHEATALAICLALAACGGGETRTSAPSATSWSSTLTRTQPMGMTPVAPPIKFQASRLPSWSGPGQWWRAGATGQAVGWKLSDNPAHSGLRVVIVLDKGKLQELPPPELDGQRLELDLNQNLHINLRGHVLGHFGAHTALWNGQAWVLRPDPPLAVGETLVRERMVSLNNHGLYLLALETTLADGSPSTRGMVIDGTKVRIFPGTPTALGDGGHVAVQDTRDGQLQASVYQLDGSYLMGGRITWSETTHLPKVMALLDDGTALGWVFIPGLGASMFEDQFRNSSLFRARPSQVEVWPRGLPWGEGVALQTIFGGATRDTHIFNRLGDLSTSLVIQAKMDLGNPQSVVKPTLVMNDQVFDAYSLLEPGPDNPVLFQYGSFGSGSFGIAISDNRSFVHCDDYYSGSPLMQCWTIEPIYP